MFSWKKTREEQWKNERQQRQKRERMRRLCEGASSNASNVSDENLPIDIDVTNTPNLKNESVQHTPIEMIVADHLTPLM